MIGDRLLITQYHRDGAQAIWDALVPRMTDCPLLAVTIAGESGSGKSEMAHCLAELVQKHGRTTLLLGQDDYFRLPPRSNHERRKEDIQWVGVGEVQLDLIDKHLVAAKSTPGEPFEKPLVDFEANSIGIETVRAPQTPAVLVVEGTYTSLLKHADFRAFIDRTYEQNRANRLKRARDPDPEFLERVLAIEHAIISQHLAMADVVIPAPAEERDMAAP